MGQAEEPESHFSNFLHPYAEIADLILALTTYSSRPTQYKAYWISKIPCVQEKHIGCSYTNPNPNIDPTLILNPK